MTMFHQRIPEGSTLMDKATTSQHKYLRIDHATSNGLNDAGVTGMTWSWHIKPDATQPLWSLMLSKGSAYAIYWYTYGKEQRVYTYFYSTGHAYGTTGIWTFTQGNNWNPDGWHHLALSWDISQTALADELKLVVDGQRLDNGSVTGAAGLTAMNVDATSGLSIGGHDSGSDSYPHDAEYRHVAIYNSVLTTARMQELMTIHPVPGEESLQSYWPLTTDFKDYAGRHNNDLEPKYAGYVPTVAVRKPDAKRSIKLSQSATAFTSSQGAGINAARHTDDAAWTWGASDFTVEFWWCYGDLDSNLNEVLGKFAAGNMAWEIRDQHYTYGRYFRLGVSSDGTYGGTDHSWKTQYWSSSVTNNVTSATTYRHESSVWTHFAWVYDVSQVTVPLQHALYMDGVLLTTASGNVSWEAVAAPYIDGAVQSTVHDNNADLVLGNFDSTTDDVAYQFDGRMCEIRLWNTARSTAEIAANYNKDLDPTTSGLAAYWKGDSIDDGGTIKIKDHSSNANHLTPDGDGVGFSSHHPFHND